MATKSQTLITASIDGNPIGTWDTRAGGETSASVQKYRPGGGGELTSAARPTTGDVTLTRRYDLARDAALATSLRTKVGRAKIRISEQPLDDDGVKWGKPTIWNGVLSSVATDDTESNADDPRIFTLVAVITKVS